MTTKKSTSKVLAEKVVAICEDVKAVDINVYDMTKSPALADFYVICTGNSEPHLNAIGNRLEKDLREGNELSAKAIDGGASSQWIVMDFGVVIVHIMHPDAREYYGLETLWQNGNLTPEKLPWECPEREILTSERKFNRIANR